MLLSHKGKKIFCKVYMQAHIHSCYSRNKLCWLSIFDIVILTEKKDLKDFPQALSRDEKSKLMCAQCDFK